MMDLEKVKKQWKEYNDVFENSDFMDIEFHISMADKVGALISTAERLQKQLDAKLSLVNNGWEEERYVLQNRVEELELFVNDLVFIEDIFKQAKRLLGNE